MSEWALLVPLTDEARSALGGRPAVEIDCLPFRVGRESRIAMVKGELQYVERRKGNVTPNNELYLYDSGARLNISREHFQIDMNSKGELFVYDRGSACGTHVDGRAIGGRDSTGIAPIQEGSEIVVGLPDSPYRFTLQHLERLGDLAREDD